MSAPTNTPDFLHQQLRGLPNIIGTPGILCNIRYDQCNWSQHKICTLSILRENIEEMKRLSDPRLEERIQTLRGAEAAISAIVSARVQSIFPEKWGEEKFSNFPLVPPIIPHNVEEINLFAYTMTPLGVEFYFEFGAINQGSINFLSSIWLNNTQVVPSVDVLAVGAPENVQ